MSFENLGLHEALTRAVADADAADPRSFKVLERGYAADAGRVWFNGKRVEAADAGTFAPLPTSPDAPDAEDARATYVRGERRPK